MIGWKFQLLLNNIAKIAKTLVRIADETYGSWSTDFKINYVMNGLLNFVEHYCDNHIHCSRFIWYSRCCDSNNGYQPNQEYCHEITSGRGENCNKLTTKLFKLLSKAWIHSSHMESFCKRSVNQVPTSGCEAFMHANSIDQPKWMNIKPEQYRLGIKKMIINLNLN